MANFFYRNTMVRIATELLDSNNNLVGVNTSFILFYIRFPNNIVYSNDSGVASKISTGQYDSGIAISSPQLGIYTVDYQLTQAGDYKYKVQVNNTGVGSAIITAVAGTINVISDGIF